jgi:hypothetical protein
VFTSWAEHWNDDPHPFVWTKTGDPKADAETLVRRRRLETIGGEIRAGFCH